MDVVIPIVFPDYRITVEVDSAEVDIFPYVDIDNFKTPRIKERLSNLGHAGILFVNGENGITKYYEYGRYDPPANIGLVRRIPIKNVKVSKGKIILSSLKAPLGQISRISGQYGRIQGVYIEVENKYSALLNYAESRKAQNSNPNRKRYSILRYSCIHFVKEMAEVAGIDTPWMVDPRPNSYIGEFRDDLPDLDFNKGVLKIENLGIF